MPDDALYIRQNTLHLNIPNDVTVVGLGGIGAWVAIGMAMSGVSNLFLFDPDNMEESNRNRLPFCQGSINVPKVEVVANFCRAIRPDANIVAIAEKLEDLYLRIQLSTSSLFMDCTDSPKAQYNIFQACKKIGKRYIRIGYDGTHGTISSNVSGWIKTDVEEEAYTVNPSWVVPSAVFAMLGVGKALKYPDQEVSIDLSEIGIPVLRKKSSRLTNRCATPPRGTGRTQVGNANRGRR